MKILEAGPPGLSAAAPDDLSEHSLDETDLSELEPVEGGLEQPADDVLEQNTRAGLARVISLVEEARKRSIMKKKSRRSKKIESYIQVRDFAGVLITGQFTDKKI